MSDYPKAIKKLIYQFKCEAHEREPHRELGKLDAFFDVWRKGEISSGELAILVEDYSKGSILELLKRYNNRYQDMNVAYALVTGILGYEEVPEELVVALERHIAFYEELKAKNNLRMPGE